MALWNCKCLFWYDKNLLNEALSVLLAKSEQPEKVQRIEEIMQYVYDTPDCSGGIRPDWRKCMADELRNARPDSNLREKFLRAAKECARPQEPTVREGEENGPNRIDR